jgi:hypothetical protein
MYPQDHDLQEQQRVIDDAIRFHGGFPFGEIRQEPLPMPRLGPLAAMIVGILILIIFIP